MPAPPPIPHHICSPPPTHTGQLALAALRNGVRGDGVKLSGYLERAARRGAQALAGSGQAPPSGDLVKQLLAALDDIDKLGMEGAQKVCVGGVGVGVLTRVGTRAGLAQIGGGAEGVCAGGLRRVGTGAWLALGGVIGCQ